MAAASHHREGDVLLIERWSSGPMVPRPEVRRCRRGRCISTTAMAAASPSRSGRPARPSALALDNLPAVA
jgi:hypothetical protein